MPEDTPPSPPPPGSDRGEPEQLDDAPSVAQRHLQGRGEMPYLSRLTLGLPHRFNNVITGAVFATEECLMDSSASAEMHERLTTIASSLREALTFVNRVVRLHANEQDDDTSYYDLQEIIDGAMVLLRLLLPKGTAFDFVRAPEKIVCYASRRRIEEILLHLVGNVGEATAPPTGAVWILVRQNTKPETPGVDVFVRDNGPGIAPEIADRIFEPFTTTKIGRAAAGVGLFRARECARAMGGELVARNHPDGGAEFVLSLPQAGD